MKTSICMMGLMLASLFGYSQTMVGLRGNVSSTWFLNKEVSDAGDELDYKGSYAGGIGIAAIHMFGEKSGIEVGIGSNTMVQQYQGTFGEETFVSQTKLNFIDIPILFKSISETGFYFEIGPKISLLGSVQDSFVSPEEEDRPTTDKDIAGTMFSGVLGFGWFFDLNDNLKLGTGLRFNYGLNDLTTEVSLEDYGSAEFENSLNGLAHTYFPEQFDPMTLETTREESLEYGATHGAALDLNIGLYYVFD